MTEGTIEIRGLRCRGRERDAGGDRGRERDAGGDRAREREYLVDVWVRADIARAIASDALADAVDIGAIAETVRAVIADTPRTLVERVAADVARALLERFAQVRDARVRVTKPEPAGIDAAAESVELVLAR